MFGTDDKRTFTDLCNRHLTRKELQLTHKCVVQIETKPGLARVTEDEDLAGGRTQNSLIVIVPVLIQ